MTALTANDVAGRLNLKRLNRSWRGDCPACGYVGTFVLKSKDGNPQVWCASCRDSAALHAKLNDIAGGATVTIPEHIAEDPAERIAKAMAVWNGSVPAANTPARLYLVSRGLGHLATSPALRWRPDCSHPEGAGSRYPAMVALVSDGFDKPCAVHRTYINAQGCKSGVTPAKASHGPLLDGAIRLAEAGRELVIGEGIETAASAGLLMNLPAWAAVAAGHMAYVALPVVVRHVIIAADPDGPGREAARRAARRWHEQGRKVTIATPDQPGKDFSDILMAKLAAEVRHG